jgi:RHS repeat-associated protein
MITKSMQSGAHQASYEYRYGSKLKIITSSFPDEASTLYYIHDGLGKLRVRTLDPYNAYTWYRWDKDFHMIAQYNDGDGDFVLENLAMTFPHDPTRLFGTALGLNVGANPSTGTYKYFLQDAYGSTRQLRLQDKSLAGAWDYAPYGDLYHGGGDAPVFMYTGQFFDQGLNSYYFPYRFYPPSLGRWMTPEPTGQDGPNLYWYASDNPVSNVDLYGECPFLVTTLVGAGAGGIIGGISSSIEGRGFWRGFGRGALAGGLVGAGGWLGSAAGGFLGGMLGGGIGGAASAAATGENLSFGFFTGMFSGAASAASHAQYLAKGSKDLTGFLLDLNSGIYCGIFSD